MLRKLCLLLIFLFFCPAVLSPVAAESPDGLLEGNTSRWLGRARRNCSRLFVQAMWPKNDLRQAAPTAVACVRMVSRGHIVPVIAEHFTGAALRKTCLERVEFSELGADFMPDLGVTLKHKDLPSPAASAIHAPHYRGVSLSRGSCGAASISAARSSTTGSTIKEERFAGKT